MKPGEDFYGWGVFEVPMERELRSGASLPLPQGLQNAGSFRELSRDIPWRILGGSVLTTLMVLIGFLLLYRTMPESPLPPEPKPVEVAVRIWEEVREIPPPVVPEPPEPVAEKVPVPEPVVVQEKTVLMPEKTVPEVALKPTKPIHVQPRPEPLPLLPPPQRPSPLERPAREQEEALPEPSLSDYEETSAPAAAALPRKTRNLHADAPAVDLGAKPSRARVLERGTVKGTMPAASPMNLDRSEDGTDLDAVVDVVEPRLNNRYENLADSTAMPSSLPQRTVAALRDGGETDIGLPKATVFDDSGPRNAIAQFPSADRKSSVFTGNLRKADLDLPGPSVQKASLPKSQPAPAAAGTSFDFLDRISPADLDRSVLLNLNRLRTCLDPAEEFTLKTRLASMLSRPCQCRSGGVVFDIRHPESAYSIHIDLYLYEHREFQDRCAALRSAVYSCEARR